MAMKKTLSNPLVGLWKSITSGDLQFEGIPEALGEYRHDLLSYASSEDFEHLTRSQLKSDGVSKLAGFEDVLTWLTMPNGRSAPMVRPQNASAHKVLKFLPFMDILKRRILQEVQSCLEPRFNSGDLPEKGVLLSFTSQLHYAYIISFDFSSGRPEITIIDRIIKPHAIFDLSHFPKLRSQRSKNAAKKILSGGQKIVIHRGILTHVNRAIDHGVFGPTIDTMILAEEIIQAAKIYPERVLEIGCGNGHIISTASARLETVKNAVFVDVNPHATSCTLRNLVANLSIHRHGGSNALDHRYGVTGKFNAELSFGQNFDLVVSNPPYIAVPPNADRGFIRSTNVAISGTELLEEIVRAARKLLSPRGKMLLMTSSTSEQAITRALHSSLMIEKATVHERFSVPFDVEDALDNPKWISWLEENSLVRKTKGEYFHDLIPIWIRRKNP